MAYELVVIGASWGGLSALRELIGGLPREVGLPLVVVRHRHRESSGASADGARGLKRTVGRGRLSAKGAEA